MSEIKKAKKDLRLMIILFKSYQTLVEYIKDDLKDINFDLNEFSVFEVIYHYKCITINEIKDKVLVASSSLSYILDKLERKGLIERTKDEDDKRVTHVCLTTKGTEVSLNIFPRHYEELTKAFDVLTDEEKEVAGNILKKLSLSIGEK